MKNLVLLAALPFALAAPFLAICAAALLAWRGFVWLQTAVWENSVCDLLTANVPVTDATYKAMCSPLGTQWQGVNTIFDWVTWRADASIAFLVAGVCLGLIAMLIMSTASA